MTTKQQLLNLLEEQKGEIEKLLAAGLRGEKGEA